MINLLDVTCGGINIPAIIPNLVGYLILGIQIFIPIVLIVLGMLDMGKAVLSNDEKTMKEAQGRLIKRIIYAVIIFLIVSIVKIVVGVVANVGGGVEGAQGGITTCIDAFTKTTNK